MNKSCKLTVPRSLFTEQLDLGFSNLQVDSSSVFSCLISASTSHHRAVCMLFHLLVKSFLPYVSCPLHISLLYPSRPAADFSSHVPRSTSLALLKSQRLFSWQLFAFIIIRIYDYLTKISCSQIGRNGVCFY